MTPAERSRFVAELVALLNARAPGHEAFEVMSAVGQALLVQAGMPPAKVAECFGLMSVEAERIAVEAGIDVPAVDPGRVLQ
jgi:hypothetical protein